MTIRNIDTNMNPSSEFYFVYAIGLFCLLNILSSISINAEENTKRHRTMTSTFFDCDVAQIN